MPYESMVQVSLAIRREERLLFVQRGFSDSTGGWDLPGGWVQPGEELIEAARRILAEQAGLGVLPEALVGMYYERQGPVLCFVFTASPFGEPRPAGAGIRDVTWISLQQAAALPDGELVKPAQLRLIFRDLEFGLVYPLAVIK